jgi:hypothetical protein
VALTGYETVTVFQSDFNATQSFWYDKYMPYRVPIPGTLCDPHVINVEDPFTTNYTFFEWAIESITGANAGNSGISYKGATLDDLRGWRSSDMVGRFYRGSAMSTRELSAQKHLLLLRLYQGVTRLCSEW